MYGLFYEITRVVKFMETESGMPGARGRKEWEVIVYWVQSFIWGRHKNF